MFARGTRTPAARRRGVVLILVLAMLGLLAVIGVSFATFSGQARKGAQNFAKRINRPNIDELLESAIAQLINDSTNPMSAIYGHGLLRDMYGNDASTNGFYEFNPDGSRPTISSYTFTPPSADAPEAWVVVTNIPASVDRDFLYWTLSLPSIAGGGGLVSVAQTYQVIGQSFVGGFYQLTLSGTHVNQLRQTPPAFAVDAANNSLLTLPLNGRAFTLDGRYRRAFNGQGMAALNGVTGGLIPPAFTNPVIANGNTLAGQFANFRVSGGLLQGNPDAVAPFDGFDLLGVDEDYDAPDLENWFLAVQSADGSISVPSFHRPGILVDHNPNPIANRGTFTDMDYPKPDPAMTVAQRRLAIRALSKILTLRRVDHPTANFPTLNPDPNTGKIVYPVDNDGDGTPESVWLDLGFPPQRAEDGTLFKPLFSFLVLGLNGKLPLNTAGNLNARADANDPNLPGGVANPTNSIDESGMPLFDHAAHLGVSPSEINPLYALQSGRPFDPATAPAVTREWGDSASGTTISYQGPHQFDNAVYSIPDSSTNLYYRHIPVALTQLRNILAGTRPYNAATNGDQNSVTIDYDTGGNPINVDFANNVINGPVSNTIPEGDGRDVLTGGVIDRTTAAIVAGRWGEPDAVTPTLAAYNTPGDVLVPALLRALNYSAVDLTGDGSADVLNTVQAGRSPFAANQYRIDGIDDNYDTYDFFPLFTGPDPTNFFSGGGPEAGRNFDDGNTTALFPSIARDNIIAVPAIPTSRALGMPMLASERFQRDVTPRDTSGNGVLSRFDLVPVPTTPVPYNVGPDARGRVSFFHYFRPPGVPLDVDDESLEAVKNGRIDERLIPLKTGSTLIAPNYVIEQSRHNITHSYESSRQPVGTNAHHMAAMPYNLSNVNGPPYAPRTNAGTFDAVPPTDLFAAGGNFVGTMDESINSSVDGQLNPSVAFGGVDTPVNSYPFGGLQFNDPNEMNLYRPNRDDAPFGPHDVEWLYRQQDVDGQSLRSRLADLAPISFVHSLDASTRRRLFTDATWDRIEASFAHDNLSTPDYPRGVGNIYNPNLTLTAQPQAAPYLAPADPARAPAERQQQPQYNARFPLNLSASIEAMGAKDIGLGVFTPQVFHGGRKINLNHPLPHSYDPFEPVRQKWITETYETLKLILPPQAIDTPQELAKLGQYVVNIVDFRDPDNAITVWTNPDIVHRGARRDTTDTYDLPPSIHLPYRADGSTDPEFALGTQNLVHYGMEYQPVALNEVLAFQSNYADPAATGMAASTTNYRANIMYIELANTLTEAVVGGGGGPTTASDLDLKGWDFMLVKEDPTTALAAGVPYFDPVYVRPDPINGQTPFVEDPTATTPAFLPEDADTTTEVPGQVPPIIVGSGKKPDLTDLMTRKMAYTEAAAALDPPVDAIDANGDVTYTVLGGFTLRTAGAPGPMPAPTNNLDAITKGIDTPHKEFDPVPGPGPGGWDDFLPATDDPAFTDPAGLYYWLYLRRPANPLLAPDPTTNPMVVVDSIRFPFSRSEGTGETADVSGGPPNPPMYQDRRVTPPSQPIYSIERPQPFRGGQIVPDPEDITRPLMVYGNSLQARASKQNDGYGIYNTPAPDAASPPPVGIDVTLQLRQTIKKQNDVSDIGGATPAYEVWDFMPFNDRDYVSVAELMLVPACPPGLFTKQFVEVPPDVLNGDLPQVAVDTTPADGDPDTGTMSIYFRVPPTVDADIPDETFSGVLAPIPHTQARTYPYLAHEFFYSSDPTYAIDPNGTNAIIPDRGHVVGGDTSAGWHRMLEFFEVPAPNIDAIGPVAQGINLDWYRQDRRPGLINPNLIVDEEVFFGLVDDPRLLHNANFLTTSLAANKTVRPLVLPQVVTQVDVDGVPLYPAAPADNENYADNRGYTAFTIDLAGSTLAIDPLTEDDVSTSLNYPFSAMKVPFTDFLKQRHGGSGFLFGFGDSGTGYGLAGSGLRLARDRPYRSMAYVDVQESLLRPATMPPSNNTAPVAQGEPTVGPIVLDPGLKASQTYSTDNLPIDPGFVYQFDEANSASYYANPVVNASATDRRPIYPGIPPRRLFQIPDSATPGPSNAMIAGTPDYTQIDTTYTALSGAVASLFPEHPAPVETYLGGIDPTTIATTPGPNQDMRRHPYYRTELIQKLSNLTTPRTHQFAVWLTVGFFEVADSGDRAQLVPDVMGPEIGASSGKIERYRAFFVLDRSKATGYDPRNPGDYRDVVLYSRRIE